MAGPWLCVGGYLRGIYSGLRVACASHSALREAAFFIVLEDLYPDIWHLPMAVSAFPWKISIFLGF